MNEQIRHRQWLNGWRRGRQAGSCSVGAIVALAGGFSVTVIAIKLGIGAIKWYIEEKTWEAIIEAGGYALMPSTRSDLRYKYMQYCDFKVGSVANYGITPQLMSESDFCWMEYGVDMSVLTP